MGDTMIRHARNTDLDTLVYLISRMHDESRFRVLPYAPERVHDMFSALLGGFGIILVAEDEHGDIYGLMAGVIGPQWFSDALVAQDLALYVTPERRGGMASARLLDAFVGWARSKGAKMIDVGTGTGIQTERTGRFFERMGGQFCGQVYSWGARACA